MLVEKRVSRLCQSQTQAQRGSVRLNVHRNGRSCLFCRVSWPYCVQAIRCSGEHPHRKSPALVCERLCHDRPRSIEDSHNSSWHWLPIGPGYNPVDGAFWLTVRQDEVISPDLWMPRKGNRCRRCRIISSGIEPTWVGSVPRRCVVQVDTQMILACFDDAQLVATIRTGHGAVPRHVLC